MEDTDKALQALAAKLVEFKHEYYAGNVKRVDSESFMVPAIHEFGADTMYTVAGRNFLGLYANQHDSQLVTIDGKETVIDYHMADLIRWIYKNGGQTSGSCHGDTQGCKFADHDGYFSYSGIDPELIHAWLAENQFEVTEAGPREEYTSLPDEQEVRFKNLRVWEPMKMWYPVCSYWTKGDAALEEDAYQAYLRDGGIGWQIDRNDELLPSYDMAYYFYYGTYLTR